jgi:L-threonylcarbamoyladenylate synthase
MADLRCVPVSDSSLTEAATALRQGGLCIVPTDTIYGIAADVRRDDAVSRLYEAKGKGPAAPLQMLFSPDRSRIERYARLTVSAEALVAELGPGGWTIIVPAKEGWDSPALAGGRTVGVRIPDCAPVHALVDALDAPLVASSANQHGGASPKTCAEALAQVGAFCAVALDGGPTPQGLDSTVIDLSSAEPRILREGAIDRQTVARILGVSEIPVLRSVRP